MNRGTMENNKLFMTIIMVAVMCVSCFTMGFVVGRYHEREHSKARIIAPFVDIEYNIDK